MKNSTNSTAVLVVNLIADATGIQPPSEWIQHLNIFQNAERIDRQVNSPYYKNADYVRRNRAYTPLLRTCGRLCRTALRRRRREPMGQRVAPLASAINT